MSYPQRSGRGGTPRLPGRFSRRRRFYARKPALKGETVDGVERLMWWLFGSSAGAATRVRIVRAIKDAPRNNQKLCDDLALDYTTVRHHLRVLFKNGFVMTGGPKYGQLFFLSPSFESHWTAFERIAAKVVPQQTGGNPHGTE
jgi:DNA-binding transcriptional ArsR family regulator